MKYKLVVKGLDSEPQVHELLSLDAAESFRRQVIKDHPESKVIRVNPKSTQFWAGGKFCSVAIFYPGEKMPDLTPKEGPVIVNPSESSSVVVPGGSGSKEPIKNRIEVIKTDTGYRLVDRPTGMILEGCSSRSEWMAYERGEMANDLIRKTIGALNKLLATSEAADAILVKAVITIRKAQLKELGK